MTVALALFDHQVKAVAKVESLDGKAGVFAEMGTGKSLIALTYLANRVSRVLVVCPISVAGVWRRECAKFSFPLPVVNLIGSGTIVNKAAAVKAAGNAIVLVNYESYWRKALQDAILKWQPEAVILDEAQRIRHRTSKQSRFAHRLANQPFVRYRLALTGTPISNGLQDVYSLYRFIDPKIFGTRWADFQSFYLQMGGWQMREIKGYKNIDHAKALIDRTSFQCRKDEVLDLPERTDVEVPVTLDAKTRRFYNELKRNAVAQIKDAEGKDRIVLARIVLTMILRLQQVTSGFATDSAGAVLDISNEKARTAIDLITDAIDTGQRVVVFARFLHDLDAIAAAMPAHMRHGRLDGSVSHRDREELIDAFHKGSVDVLLAQTRVGSVGIDLTPASIGIFVSTGFSLDDFQQARDRLHRIGQRRPVTYYHLIAEGTVDEKVYRALTAKTDIARRVTDLSYALDLISS